jgi:carotenoid 1,2-hydratase
MTPAFDRAVPAGGYVWWYLDALSDDGRHGLTIIAFIGSVFSPYYAWARRGAAEPGADPLQHCALNVALYTLDRDRRPRAWTMTERSETAVRRSSSRLQIGPSALEWDDGAWTVHIDETTAPWPRKVRGVVRLQPLSISGEAFALDGGGRHHWQPIAPRARVEIDLASPALRWSGDGYLDSNSGSAPLERDFVRWDWSRAALSGGRSGVLYDLTRRDGSRLALALQFDAQGRAEAIAPPPPAALPASGWRVGRSTRSEGPAPAQLLHALEDGPFYARSLVQARWLGEPVRLMHESLDLDRFASRWVQLLLPFRMPRRSY